MEAPPPPSSAEGSPSPSTGESTTELELSQTPPMFRSLSEVFQSVVPWEKTGLDFDGWPKLLERADSGFGTGKALRTVVSVLEYLEQSSPVSLALATKLLADGSRYESYRLLFGDNNVLDFYLDILAEDENEHDWTSDALRLVGNSCADLDINRERALAKLKLPALLLRLNKEDKADITIGLLCNLCLDYEPAQVALRANRLFPSIIQLFERRCYNLDFLPQVSFLLDIAIEEFNPELYPNTQAITVTYQVIITPGVDIETQISLANAILALLEYEQIQKALIENDKVSTLLDLFVFSYTQDAANAEYQSSSTSESKLYHPAQDPEDEAQLTALRSALSARLWDITALTEFTVKYSPISEFVQRLIAWLSIDEPQMQVCACSILRNVASSDQNATNLVMTLKIHRLLTVLLDRSSNLQVLEELIRLMKNLAVPAANKKELQNFESVTLLWSKFQSPTLHYAAVSHVRQLLRGCFENVLRFLGQNTSAKNDSYASRLLQLYSNTNDPAIKTEVTRTIVELWRTTNSGDGEEVCSQGFLMEKAVREVNLQPDEMIQPVVAIIVESENPSLVTEGWFGLALMASSQQLGEAIYNALCGGANKGIFKAAVSNQEAHSKDRDNARILADRLLKHSANNPARLDVLRPLLPVGASYSEMTAS